VALPLNYDFNGGTAAAAVATTDTGSGDAFDVITLTGGTIAYDATQVAHGAMAAKFTFGTGICTVQWSTKVGTITEYWGRIYIWAASFPAGGQPLVRARTSNNGRVRVTAGKLDIYDGTTIVTGTVALATSAWNRIEFHINGSLYEARLWKTPDSAGAPDDSITGSAFTSVGSITGVEIGFAGTPNPGTPFWFDDINVNATGWPGPAVAAAGGRTQPVVRSQAIRRSTRWREAIIPVRHSIIVPRAIVVPAV
jgi:hypothetical protein